MRSHMLEAGARAIEKILEPIGCGRRQSPLVCAQNHLPVNMESQGVCEKTLHTILGAVRFRRSAFKCPVCDKILYPGDEILGVEGTGFSPGARRMMARAGSKESFAESADDLELFANLRVDPKDVERVAENTGRVVDEWMARNGTLARLVPPDEEEIETMYVSFDGTGVPMRRAELEQTRGKAPDGKAKTREVVADFHT